MKKILSLLVVCVLVLSLASTAAFAVAPTVIDGGSGTVIYSGGGGSDPSGSGAVVIDQGTVIIAPADETTAGYGGQVVVTKSPTSETVERGAKATFVAHAANKTGITWRLVSADGLETINVAAIADYFKGVETWGLNTDSLTIKNIPDNMNGWLVEAKFDGPGGPVYSAGARISVVGSSANGTTHDKNQTGRVVIGGATGNAPTITAHPTGATLSSGKSTTLSVTAGVGDGSTLHYQWYVTADSSIPGQAIAGATSASYTPGELPGTRYYYVGVWSEKDGVKSDTVYSTMAEIVYPETPASPTPSAAPATPVPTASVSGTSATGTTGTAGTSSTGTAAGTSQTKTDGGLEIVPAPSDDATGTEASPAPASEAPTRTTNTAASSLPVILGAIAAVALAAGVGLLVLRRNAGS